MIFNDIINPVRAQLGEGTGKGILSACIHGNSLTNQSTTTSQQTLLSIPVPAKAMAQLGDHIHVFAFGSLEPDYTDDIWVEFGGVNIMHSGSWTAFFTRLNWVLESRIWFLTTGAAQFYNRFRFYGHDSELMGYLSVVDFNSDQTFVVKAKVSNTGNPFKVECSSASIFTKPS